MRQRQRERNQEPRNESKDSGGEGNDSQPTTRSRKWGMAEVERPKTTTTWNCSSTHRLRRSSAMFESIRQKKETNLYTPLNLRPSFGVKHGVLVLLLDLRQEPPSRSAVGDVVVGRTALVVARVELADHVSLAVAHMPNERA